MHHDFFELSENPFGLTPDPKYLFPSEVYEDVLAHITDWIEEQRGVMLVLGEAGTGKTTLIHDVLGRLGPNITSAFVFYSMLAFEDLLEAMLRDLEVPIPSNRTRVDLTDALTSFLLREHAVGRRVLLIIDEAQHLTASVIENLRMLSNLETARSKLLQIVLVGQPELGEILDQANRQQLRQQIGLVAELRPLSRGDTVRYVEHRLAVAGWQGRRIFTRAALRVVHRASKGIPRLINVICDKSLLLGYDADKKRVGRRIVGQVVRDWSSCDVRLTGVRARRGPAPVRRKARRRGRPAVFGVPIAAVVVGALFTGGSLVVRSPTPNQTVVRPPTTAVPAARPSREGTGDAGSSSPIPEPRVIDRPLVEQAVAPAVNEKAPNDRPREGMEVPSPRPFTDVLTVPAATRSLERPVAVVTVQTEDTLLWLLSSVYGRVDETVIDVVQLANPSVALPRAGERLSLPPVKSATMVHMLDDGRYVVHLLTTSDPADRRLRRLRPDILASGRKIRLVPVRLWTGCEACYRVWVGEFESRSEAEAFYRHVRPWDAA